MCLNLNYWLIAPTGQVPTHVPQSMQVPSSQTDFPSSFNERAPTGHPPTQAPCKHLYRYLLPLLFPPCLIIYTQIIAITK